MDIQIKKIIVAGLFGISFAANAQIINNSPPTTAGTGLSKSGTALSVIYGTTGGTSLQGNLYGAANGVATLNGSGILQSSQLPTVPASKGGTGTTGFITGRIALGQAGGGLDSMSSFGSPNQVLRTTGVGGSFPFWDYATNAINNPGNPPIMPDYGGTGIATPTAHYIPVGNGSSAMNQINPDTANMVLTSNGPSSDPTFQYAPFTYLGVSTITPSSSSFSLPSVFTTGFGQNLAHFKIVVKAQFNTYGPTNFLKFQLSAGGSPITTDYEGITTTSSVPTVVSAANNGSYWKMSRSGVSCSTQTFVIDLYGANDFFISGTFDTMADPSCDTMTYISDRGNIIYSGATLPEGFTISTNTGNFVGGVVYVYGYKG